jgi:hypothetical protein
VRSSIRLAIFPCLAVASVVAYLAPATAQTVATVQVVIRPVSSTGQPAPGFTVADGGGPVYCSRDPSPGAVDPNIETCGPAAAYVVACWHAAAVGKVLCTRDPSEHSLVSFTGAGGFVPTTALPPEQRAPLLLVLDDGTRCQIRVGGSWSKLKSHPDWLGTYGCGGVTAAWEPPNALHGGVDESTPSWTVKTASMAGTGPLVTRHVRMAYFVGTAEVGATLPSTGAPHLWWNLLAGVVLVVLGALLVYTTRDSAPRAAR